jgi:hypothetical protein
MKAKSLIMGAAMLLTQVSFSGTEGGGGGDTYTSQMIEARELAVAAMTELKDLKTVSVDLRSSYRANRLAWIEVLKRANFIPVTEDLYDNDVKKGMRAALAYEGSDNIYLSQSYWGKYPISLVQSVILAIHEAGHLASIPLSHTQFDQIGEAVKREKLGDFFGQKGLDYIKQTHQNSSPSDILKKFFEQAPEPATIDNLRIGDVFGDRKFQCILTSSKRNFGNGEEVIDYAFDIQKNKNQSMGPLFGESEETEYFTIVKGYRPGSSSYAPVRPVRNTYLTERTSRDLVIKGNYDLAVTGPSWDRDAVFSFRRSGDLTVFSLDTQPSYGANYGYCWPLK